MFDLKKKVTFNDLNGWYSDSSAVDYKIFCEMKTNGLLIAGEHYSRKFSDLHRRLLGPQDVAAEQRIRLTKNHIHRIHKRLHNNLVAACPDVSINPANKKSNQSIKCAQMYASVYSALKREFRLNMRKNELADSFLSMGEACMEVLYDPNAGPVVREDFVRDEMGQPILDKDGQPQKKVIRRGGLIFNEYLGYNVRRDAGSISVKDSPIVGLIDIVHEDYLKELIGDENDPRMKLITPSQSEESPAVWDPSFGDYRNLKNHVEFRKTYYRPCRKYPTGYYYYHTLAGILFEGPLLEGAFPVCYGRAEIMKGIARGVSIIRDLRPNQVELNRKVSKSAENEVVHGDDKVLLPPGGKLTPAGKVGGAQGLQYGAGGTPVVIAGRNGQQYYEGIDREVEEMYRLADLEYQEADLSKALDPYTLLFSSMRDKKRFSVTAERFEELWTDVVDTALRMFKAYASDDWIIHDVGSGEAVHIPEFKAQDDLGYQIAIDKQAGDIETKLGQQIVLNQILQYTATNLSRQQIGSVIRNMPFTNQEEIFGEFTQDYDMALSISLRLDRGEMLASVPVRGDLEYLAGFLERRMNKQDFETLGPQIQQNYKLYMDALEEQIASNAMALKEAEAQFIPMDGPVVNTDLKIPAGEGKSDILRMPANALYWLADMLEKQNYQLKKVSELSQQTQVGIAGKIGGNAPNQEYPQNVAPISAYGDQLSHG